MTAPEILVDGHNTPYVVTFADDAQRWGAVLGLLEDWLLHAGDDTRDELAEFLDDPAGPRQAIDTLAESGRHLRRLADKAVQR